MSQYCYMIIKAVLYSPFLSFPPVPFFSSGSCQNTLHLVVISPWAPLDCDDFSDLFFCFVFDNLIALRITVQVFRWMPLYWNLCYASSQTVSSTALLMLTLISCLRKYLWVFSTVKLLSVSLIPYSPLWREITRHSPHSGELSLRAGWLHKLFGILHRRFAYSSPFIYLSNYLCHCRLNATLFYCSN